jgi:DHA1 family bicyclomycin/chloramphenicol resistance-like MFS transporter
MACTTLSVFGFIQTADGALLHGLTGQYYNGTVAPIVAGYGDIGALALTCVLVAARGRLVKVREYGS